MHIFITEFDNSIHTFSQLPAEIKFLHELWAITSVIKLVSRLDVYQFQPLSCLYKCISLHVYRSIKKVSPLRNISKVFSHFFLH